MQPRSTSLVDRRLELDNRTAETAGVLKRYASRKSPVFITTHYDADGITAGSIMLAAIKRLGTLAHLRVVDSLSEKILEELSETEADLFIFTDIGSGYLDLIGKALRHKEFLVADHHQALGDIPTNAYHFNTHLLGFDGSTDISGAGTAYLLARALDPRNRDLSPMALVGCLGDQQDKRPMRALAGLNEGILKDAIEAGLVEVVQDLILFGRQTRPIHRAIAATTSPFLPGLSGEEDRCLALLDAANIPAKVDDRWRAIVDLTLEEKQRLVDKILKQIISMKLSGEVVLDLVGNVYTLSKEDEWTPLRDAREFATLLNACGRMGKPSLGVALCLGDRGTALDEAKQVYAEYKKWLSKYMNWISSEPSALTSMKNIVIVRGEGKIDENMTGAVSSLLSSSNVFGDSKVTVVLTYTKEGGAKLSARATEPLVTAGVNLGKILQDLGPRHGGNGGGHAIAAGATIERTEVEAFLQDFANMIDSMVS